MAKSSNPLMRDLLLSGLELSLVPNPRLVPTASRSPRPVPGRAHRAPPIIAGLDGSLVGGFACPFDPLLLDDILGPLPDREPPGFPLARAITCLARCLLGAWV